MSIGLKIRLGNNTTLSNLHGGELGDGLGALRDSVLGELAGEDESDGSLDLSGREGGLLGAAGQLGGLLGDSLEDIVDEGVQDGHASLGDADVGVDLLQHLVDVGRVGLGALGGSLLGGGLLGGLGSSLLSDGGSFGHFRIKIVCLG